MGQNPQLLYELFSLDVLAWAPPPMAPQVAPHFMRSGQAPTPPAPTPGNSATPPHNLSPFGVAPHFIVPGVGASGLVGAIVPAAALVTAINPAGVAVAAVVGPINGGYVTNPANASAQGIVTAENLYLDPVNPPGSTDMAASGTTVLLTPGQTFTLPAIATGVTIWLNAATSGHRVTVVVW